jgi:serine/threonine protein kinase
MSEAAKLKKNEIYELFPDIKARYELVGNKAIGNRSGFGAVWKAKDKWLLVEVAIKISDSDLSPEINYCRAIDKETVRIFEYYRSEHWHAYVMELLVKPWINLSSFIKDRKYKNNDIRHYFDSFEIIRSLLCGIESIHGTNYSKVDRFIHSDIKPDNFFVRIQPKKIFDSVFRMPAPDNLVKIIDLGISVERGNMLKGCTSAYSPQGAILGNPGVDLYAVAISFLELLTGQRPTHQVMEHSARIRNFIAAKSSGSEFIDGIAIDFAVRAKNAVTQQGVTAKTLTKFLNEKIFDLNPLMLLSVLSLLKDGNHSMSRSNMVNALFPVFARYMYWSNNTQSRRDEIAAYLKDWKDCRLIVKVDGENKYRV